jgi:hypothetical protein
MHNAQSPIIGRYFGHRPRIEQSATSELELSSRIRAELLNLTQ